MTARPAVVDDREAQPPTLPDTGMLVLPQHQEGEASPIVHESGPYRHLSELERKGLRILVDQAVRNDIGKISLYERRMNDVDRRLEEIHSRPNCQILETAYVRQTVRRWSKEEVLAAMRDWHSVYGRPPRLTEWKVKRPAGYPTWSTVFKWYDSWADAVRAAGLEPIKAESLKATGRTLPCSKCERTLPEERFSYSKDEQHRRFRRHWCRECDSVARKNRPPSKARRKRVSTRGRGT